MVGFRSVENRQGEFRVLLNHQSREDEAINGTNTQIEYEAGFPRYPLVLLLDGIVSGNQANSYAKRNLILLKLLTLP